MVAAEVDHIRITITYTEAGAGGYSETRTQVIILES